jgi:CheY-like chemotaxis protein
MKILSLCLAAQSIITFASIAGLRQGAVFKLVRCLPAFGQFNRPARKPEKPMLNGDASSSSVAAVRILIVEDLEDWRRSVCALLKRKPGLHVVGEVADGAKAVQETKELKPDLILLDISLPNLNGIEAAGRISQIAPGTKILFLSQNNDADVVQAALSHGGRGYVLKAEAESELLPAIAAVLGGDRFVSSRLKS